MNAVAPMHLAALLRNSVLDPLRLWRGVVVLLSASDLTHLCCMARRYHRRLLLAQQTYLDCQSEQLFARGVRGENRYVRVILYQ